MKGFFCGLGASAPQAVMPGIGPGIHALAAATKSVDGRDEPGHDDW
jgi:hypothetical protein